MLIRVGACACPVCWGWAGLQPKNAILAMNAAKAQAAAERQRLQEKEGPSFLAALNPIKVIDA